MIYFIIWCPHVKARISRYFESAAVFLICGCSYLLDDKSFRVKLLFSRLRKPKRSFHRFIDKFPNFIAILRARVHEAIRVESKTVNLEFIDRLPAKLKRNLLFIVPLLYSKKFWTFVWIQRTRNIIYAHVIVRASASSARRQARAKEVIMKQQLLLKPCLEDCPFYYPCMFVLEWTEKKKQSARLRVTVPFNWRSKITPVRDQPKHRWNLRQLIKGSWFFFLWWTNGGWKQRRCKVPLWTSEVVPASGTSVTFWETADRRR